VDLGVKDQVFAITGGSRGVGFATAQQLVLEGAKVVITGRDVAVLDSSVAALGGPEWAVGVVADNADLDTGERIVTTARETFGGLHGALLSVGGPPSGGVLMVTDEQWQAAFSSLFLGTLRIARSLLEAMDEGAIAFVLSSSVKVPIRALAISNGLRPGLAMLAKSLADEVGPRGIRVISLAPGRIATARTEALDAAAPGRRASGEAAIPLGRYGTAEEFGRAAAFLISPAASYISGVTISIDGGSLQCL
jgi:3-oxoacyl-[acyl-carrier protein] reductase